MRKSYPGTLMHCKLVTLFLLGIWDQRFKSQTKQGFVLFGDVLSVEVFQIFGFSGKSKRLS